MKKIIRTLFLCFVGVIFSLASNAQTDVEMARKNLRAYCMGPKLPYESYSKPVVAKIQADLFVIYHEDPEWKITAAQSGKPLNDSLMGPITWSWMQRVCYGFALHLSPDLVAEFPDQLTRIAAFATKYPEQNKVLVSEGLGVWVYSGKDPRSEQDLEVLYKGSDDELLDLVRRYLARNTAQVTNAPVSKPKSKPNSLYVLRADDFVTLKQPNTLPAAIESLVNKPFANEADANVAIAKALKNQPKPIQEQASSLIHQALVQRDSYQITDKVLSELLSIGVTEPLFSELKKMSSNVYNSEELFSKAVMDALDNTKPTNMGKEAGVVESATDAKDSVSEKSSLPSSPVIADSVVLFRVVNASKVSASYLGEDEAKAITSQLTAGKSNAIPALLIDLFKGIQDMEYPEPELLHTAIQNKIVKGLGLCLLNKGNILDIKVVRLSADDQKKLISQIATIFPFVANAPQKLKLCNDNDYENVKQGYNLHLRSAIEKVYQEDMPAYSGLPIQWDGKQCGCVPNEMATLAYGIYPYWHASKEVQHYDFSTFARVAYMGLTFNDNGQLQQINAENQAQTFLTKPNEKSVEFIRVARTFGSKVDWMIEKDWAGYESSSPMQLANILDRLRISIVEQLAKPLDDPLSRLKPWISLGVAQTPSNGDGVTLYFKNYPTAAAYKNEFDSFFTALKADLKKLSDQRNANHALKEYLFLNIIVNQTDFSQKEGVFSSSNLERLTGVSNHAIQNLSQIEMQQKVQSLMIVLLSDPYYGSLDEIYAITPETSRSLVVPIMFTDYRNMEAVSSARPANVTDERFKKLAYIHESFGGGGFWPITAVDKKGMEGFNQYVADQFAPGHNESWWNKVLCAYRWVIIAVMNVSLLLALLMVLIIFYVFPCRCKTLPSYLAFYTKPIPLFLLVAPPIILWIYLLIVDVLFPFMCITSLLALILCGLVARAMYVFVRDLQKNKPNRSFLMDKNNYQTLPSRANSRREYSEEDGESEEHTG